MYLSFLSFPIYVAGVEHPNSTKSLTLVPYVVCCMSLPIISCLRCLWIYCPLAAFMRRASYLLHLCPELGDVEMSALFQVSPKHVRTDVYNNLQIRSASSLWFKRGNWELECSHCKTKTGSTPEECGEN